MLQKYKMKSVPDHRDECEISCQITLGKRQMSKLGNARSEKRDAKIFIDSIKSKDTIKEGTTEDVNKQFSEAIHEEKLLHTDKTCTREDVLYKKLVSGNYICDICQIVFKQKGKILRHITSKHSFHRPFKCAICSKSFKYKCDLKMHRLVHQEMDSSSLHCCNKCDYRGRTKSNLKAHYIRRHTDEYRFACEHCGKRFKIEWDLKFHLGTHNGSQHMCDICGRFYTSNYSLYKHRKVAHLNEYKFHCDVCNKKLLTQENLDNHMQQHNKTYDCKECGKAFASKRYLANHATTHTGVKPYVCHVCKKCFRTSHMRNTHLVTHSTEKPYICDLCGQAFKRRYYMIVHRKKHPDAHLSSPPMPLGKVSQT
nr:PREDICTED: oocyte zinc finger protein XlCOF6.1-like [Linepithema humile]